MVSLLYHAIPMRLLEFLLESWPQSAALSAHLDRDASRLGLRFDSTCWCIRLDLCGGDVLVSGGHLIRSWWQPQGIRVTQWNVPIAIYSDDFLISKPTFQGIFIATVDYQRLSKNVDPIPLKHSNFENPWVGLLRVFWGRRMFCKGSCSRMHHRTIYWDLHFADEYCSWLRI